MAHFFIAEDIKGMITVCLMLNAYKKEVKTL